MSPSIERAIAERAREQLGHINRPQLRALGVDSRWIARRVARGTLVEVGRRTLRLAGAPVTFEARVVAACLDVGGPRGGVASHRTAAHLHGLEGFPRPSEIEVVVDKGVGSGRTPLARVHASTNLQADVVRVGPVPATSVARTLMMLSALVPHDVARERVLGAAEAAVRDGLASMRWLWWLLEERRCRGRDGVTTMEGVLAEMASLGPTESWLERETLGVIAAAGLPLPDVQRTVRRDGAFVSRVDFVYDGPKVVIEVSGKVHLTPQQASRDARQRAELQLMGYTVLDFTYRDVVERPDLVVATIARAIGAVAA